MITPEAYLAIRPPDKDDIIEKHIDAVLQNAGGKRAISIAVLHWDTEAVQRVLNKYRAAGWVTDIIGDWRDGDYISMVIP